MKLITFVRGSSFSLVPEFQTLLSFFGHGMAAFICAVSKTGDHWLCQFAPPNCLDVGSVV